LIDLRYRLFDLDGTVELMADANDIDTMIDQLRAVAYSALDLLALPPHAVHGYQAVMP
jgi:hypothetical protein